jgi:hypothetical protein
VHYFLWPFRGLQLAELLISGNPIGQRGALALAAAIQNNSKVAYGLQFQNIGALASDRPLKMWQNMDFLPAEKRLPSVGKPGVTTPSPVPHPTQPPTLPKGPAFENDEEIFYRGLYARFLGECSQYCAWPSCRLLQGAGLVEVEPGPANEASCSALSARLTSIFRVIKSEENNGADAFLLFMKDSPVGILARAVRRAGSKLPSHVPQPLPAPAPAPAPAPLPVVAATASTATSWDQVWGGGGASAPAPVPVSKLPPVDFYLHLPAAQAAPTATAAQLQPGEVYLPAPATSIAKPEEQKALGLGGSWADFWLRHA